MNQKKIDIFEVVLKEDLQLPLTEEEKEYLKDIDPEIKKNSLLLVNSEFFLEELESIIENIIRRIDSLPEQEQQDIKKRCFDRITSLKECKNQKELVYSSSGDKIRL